MASFLGFEFKRKDQANTANNSTTQFVPEVRDDGALSIAAGGQYGTFLDLDGTVRTDAELITRYREMSQQPEVDNAIENIINDAIVQDDDVPIVSVNVDETKKLPPKITNLIQEEFEAALQLLDFNQHAYDIFRTWYIDGRLYYNVVIDTKDPGNGIEKLVFIDPRKIKKVREVSRKKTAQGQGTSITVDKNEYYIYNEKGFGNNKNIASYGDSPTEGIKIAKDNVILATSGLNDANGRMILSYLNKAIKPLNMLRSLEDATVIYRISRAPERRIFYIDVGNLPKAKAEQYLRDMMVLHKNKLVYDGTTGEIRDDRKFMTLLEDYWLPRREGSRGTEITTLPAGQNLGKMEDVEYFQQKLYKSLHVPVDRLDNNSIYQESGQATQISREEMKFAMFISRLRLKFSELFKSILEKQMVLKGYMTIEEWQEIAHNVSFKFASNNYFEEAKEREILIGRLQAMQLVEPYLGRFYSADWVRHHVLCQTDELIEQIDEQIADEQEQVQFMPPEQQQGLADTAQQQDQFDQQMQMQKVKAVKPSPGTKKKPGNPGKK